MRRTPRILPLAALAAGLWLVSAASFAEPPPHAQANRARAKRDDSAHDEQKRTRAEARMKELRANVLRKRVGLESAKASEVERILDRHAPERQKAQEKLRNHRRELQRLLDQDSSDQQAYSRELKGLREAQGQLQKIRERQTDDLTKQLTPKQQAKLVLALRRLQNGLRRHLRDDTAQP